MKLSKIIDLVEGTVHVPSNHNDIEIHAAGAADLMSDVLATAHQSNAVLLTGLCNPQVVRTAVMADISAVIFVRGKQPSKETIELAIDEKLPLITSPFGMFELCGRLYQAGLASLETNLIHTNCE